jgi:ABC-2 type transport system ATP-binding protein
MIELRQLKKNYGSFTAVDSIDLTVPDGELFGFLGPNGAGKTTTLRMIAGILQPTSGSIHLAGIDLAVDPLAAKAKLGFIPDRPFIYEKLTGSEFLRFVAGLYGQDGDKIEHRGRELMALFDLEEWADELVESYSHGMRQKLIISSAFIHRPEVIVVDEPMAVVLDPDVRLVAKRHRRPRMRLELRAIDEKIGLGHGLRRKEIVAQALFVR